MIAPLLLAAGLLAHPKPDPRVALRAYEPDTITLVDTRPGFETTVQFADDEHVENIAIGDSAAWQVTPNRRANLVFVKPASAKAPITNMTVVTDKRSYLFALHVAARAQYLLRFAYPAPVVNQPAESPAPQPNPTAPRPATERLNFAWKASGDKSLLPAMVLDDGQSTYLAWPDKAALPVILEPSPDGKGAGPVNTSQSGPYIVVAGRHDVLLLQAGKKQARLTNLAPETMPEPLSPDAITAVPASGGQP
ncbi:TrbG/VirB9 family P-type conjugative transfer protein [Novosphingobium umbonatum]|nr:TrbG/VirB9 family P-type conjugative transfer protein [Novosphingobium umbonatum]